MPSADRYELNVLVIPYTVAAGQTATAGEGVILASNTTVQDAGAASDLAIGVATSTVAAGGQVDVKMYGWSVIPVEVGTAGATRGTKAQLAADGHVDAGTHDSDGTGNQSTYGIFLISGTVGQTVGMLLSGAANRGV